MVSIKCCSWVKDTGCRSHVLKSLPWPERRLQMSRSSININLLHTTSPETIQLSSVFQKGDFVVEHESAHRTGGIKFGVVMCVEKGFQDTIVLDVLFATERLYTFANHCQHYKDWLDENGF